MRHKLLIVLLSIFAISSAQTKPTQKWLDQKFSMFIHSVVFRVWRGVRWRTCKTRIQRTDTIVCRYLATGTQLQR